MKILEVCAYLYPALQYGGPAKVVYDLSVELAKENKVTVLTSDVWDQQRRIRDAEKCQSTNKITFIYTKNIVNSLAYTARFFSCFGMISYFHKNWKQFEIVHIHDVFIIPQLIVAWYALLKKIPLIVSPHGVIDPVRMKKKSLIKSILFAVLVNPVMSRAAHIIATSDKEKADLLSLGFSPVTTVWNGIPPHITTPTTRYAFLKQDKKLKGLYIGKLHSQKGLLELLNSVRPFRAYISLIIAGPDDGILHALTAYSEHHNLDVHFTGLVHDAEKSELFSYADFFVYPSYAEGFSISILEALQASLPVVITDGCNFDLVERMNAGFVLQTQSLTKQLRKTLFKILLKPEVLKEKRNNTQKLIAEYFTISHMAKAVTQIYEQSL